MEPSPSPAAARLLTPARLFHAGLAVLLLLAIGRLWLMPMWSSFWVDEMGTAFVVRHGGSHPSFGVAPQVPQSIYYFLPKAAGYFLGFSEFHYRLPSFLALGAALLVIAFLAARLIHPQAAWLVVFSCLSLRGINYQAADARPYALGTLVACAALWFLVCWLDSARRVYAMLFLVFAVLLWRVQLIFWPFYLVFGLYALTRLLHQETKVTWTHAAVACVVLAFGLRPVLIQAIELNRHAGAHVVAALPSPRELLLSLKPGLIFLCGVGGWLFSRWLRWPPNPIAVSRSSRVLILSWWLIPPACLYTFSWITGNSVFVPRYLALSLPGGVLAAALLLARYVPFAHWKALAAVMGLAALLLNGQWSRTWPWHHNSDWRAAALYIHDLQLPPDTPVLCPSPFVEAVPPAWRPDYPLPGFLYAHLDVYPLPGAIQLLPFANSAMAQQFASEMAGSTLRSAPRLVLYGGQGQVDFWVDWFSARPEMSGWSHHRERTFGDVEVVIFRNPTPLALLRPSDCLADSCPY